MHKPEPVRHLDIDSTPILHQEVRAKMDQWNKEIDIEDTAINTGDDIWVNAKMERIAEILDKQWHEVTEEDLQWWIDEALIVNSTNPKHRQLYAAMCVSAHHELTKALGKMAREIKKLQEMHESEAVPIKDILIHLIRKFNKLSVWLKRIEAFRKIG